MAKKTFLYKVMMGKGREEETRYCYARNAGIAVESFKEIIKDKKYDFFKAVAFGEADYEMYPDAFREFTKEEIAVVKNNKLGEAERYSNRTDGSPMAGAQFVTKEEMEKKLSKGESL